MGLSVFFLVIQINILKQLTYQVNFGENLLGDITAIAQKLVETGAITC
jgi:hypothetical protein